MKNSLLWKLLATIGVGTVLLFWAISWLTEQTQTKMSYLAQEHQQQLLDYGRQAEQVWLTQREAALAQWLKALQAKEDTWAAVVSSRIVPLADSVIPAQYKERYQIGRSVEWKVHLDFNYNPVMEVPFLDANTHLLIRLPQRMRPGNWLLQMELLLQFALPLLVLCALSYILYQHVMVPLRKLETATREFSMGNMEVRVYSAVQDREDELARLALTFDQMAQRTSQLIYNQRQMLSDLSHELRTPLTRIDMAIDLLQAQPNAEQALQRLRYEAQTMRELAEDTLTLAWLNTESPQLNGDSFDLVELLQVIADDARFEFPDQGLHMQLPKEALLSHSNQQALGQAIENILRNALRHTPKTGTVDVTLSESAAQFELVISDHNTLATPGAASGAVIQTGKRGGFGLGLALAQRQVQAVGGTINASNQRNNAGESSGLQIRIRLPRH